MEIDYQTIGLFAGTILTSGWLGSVLVQWIKGSTDRQNALTSAKLGREGQLDELTLELFTAAKEDLRELRSEIAVLRPLQVHLLHFEEALNHLEALTLARTDQEVAVAKQSAEAFLRRIKRTRDAIAAVRLEGPADRTSAVKKIVEGNSK